MTTQLSEHAKSILRAIADGKQIEGKNGADKWIPIDDLVSIMRVVNWHETNLRIAPETRTINGVTFPAPDGSGIYSFGGLFSQSWKNSADRNAALKAITDALEGRTK